MIKIFKTFGGYQFPERGHETANPDFYNIDDPYPGGQHIWHECAQLYGEKLMGLTHYHFRG